MKQIKHIVMFSGGIGSWAAAKRVKKDVGAKNMILLFTDTLIEDEDLYRFLPEAAKDIGAPLVWISEGRTPWEVFFDVKRMGSPQADPCSLILKRDFADNWIKSRFKPEECVVYVGVDWSEIHRFEGGRKLANGKISLGLKKRKLPYVYKAPMTDPPYLSKKQMLDDLTKTGIKPPRLYEMGFPHNNCGGFCVKAGQGTFMKLLEHFPQRYSAHEDRETLFRAFIGKNVSILRDRRGGKTKPLTLKSFRERVQTGGETDPHEFGGCGCFIDE